MTNDSAVPDCCPFCSMIIRASYVVVGNHGPRPGDVTICWGCGTWLEYDRDMSVVLASRDRLAFIKQSSECQKLLYCIRVKTLLN